MSRRALAAGAAVVGWSALVLQGVLTVRQALAAGQSAAEGLVTYLSFFTITTNVLVALALTLPLLAPRSRAGAFFARPAVATAIAVSIVVVGVTYELMLRRLWNPQGAQFAVDILLHDVMPLLYLASWWQTVPPGSLRAGAAAWWIAYPLAYLAYTLARGALTGRYPYPFVDVAKLGYPKVLVNAAGFVVFFAAVWMGLLAIARVRRTPRAGR